MSKALPIVAGVLAAILSPPAPVTPSAWAAQNLIAPEGPQAGGRWDPALTPYVPAMIDPLGPDGTCNMVVVRKSAQTGISLAGIALAGSYIDRAPCRIGYALPTIDLVQEFNAEKLSPSIDDTPALRRKVRPQTSRSATGSTSTRKKYPGGALSLINANSAPDLKSRSLKVGIADEVDAWPATVGEDGDPFELFLDRFISFHASGDWRLLVMSTPTMAGASRIDHLFQDGDQRFWRVRCPGCATEMTFEFQHLKFNRAPPYQAHYVAPCCGTVIDHHLKAPLVRAGRFVATNADGRYPSFHIDALSSMVETWDKIAEAWWRVHGNPNKERAFFNSQLGQPYQMKGDAPDWERLMERREDYAEGRVPPAALLLVGAADIQHSGIWCEVVGFGADRQSWTVTARFLDGDTTDHDRGAWLKLAEIYDTAFADAFGGTRRIEALAVDAGDGGRANQAYAWTRTRHRAHAIHGRPGWTTPAIGAPTKVDVTIRGKRRRGGALLWPVGIWSLTGDLYAYLRKTGRTAGAETDPPGYCHFGAWLDANFFRQLTAKYLADEMFRGRVRKTWKNHQPDDHFLDCRVYAMAMAEKLGLSRMTPVQWVQLAGRLGVPRQLAEPDLLAPEAERIAADVSAEAGAEPERAAPPTPDPSPGRIELGGGEQKAKPNGSDKPKRRGLADIVSRLNG
jgi:phage terminase large subunit GpA-like protein